MMKHPRREGSPIAQDLPMCPMSPNSRRRAEFTIKQLQSGMMGRARSKLSTLGDVWRPRSMVMGSVKPSADSALPPKAPSHHKTLEFLTLWARHKKTASDENAAVTTIPSRDKSQSRKSVLVDTSNKKTSSTVLSNGQTIQTTATQNDQLQQLQNRRRRHHNPLTASETNRMTASLSSVSSSGKRYSRNTSLDMSELLLDRAKIDDLVFANGRPSTWSTSPLKIRRNSYTDQVPDVLPERPAASDPSRASADLDARIIKARLKLKKVPSCEGDIESQSVTAATKPGILHRNRATTEPRLDVPTGSDDNNVPDGNCLLTVQPQRPRKKLSFRIPGEQDGQSLVIKSDTLPRARRFLERYEQTMQTQNVELEVRKENMCVCVINLWTFPNWILNYLFEHYETVFH